MMKGNKNVVLVIPPNDPEAILIKQIAKAMELSVISLGQPHGARLEKEKDLIEKLQSGGWKKVIIIETPGPIAEKELEKAGFEVIIIDHHEYTDLDRAHGKNGECLASSLDQFLATLDISDVDLIELGFDPLLVHGIAAFDRGFIWEMQKEGFKKLDIIKTIAYSKELMRSVRPDLNEDRRAELSERIWKERIIWEGFVILLNDTTYQVRSEISLLAALETMTPTPLILVEPARGFIYVQESEQAPDLFKEFGGFTFGQGNNWGYKNGGELPEVSLSDVKEVLLK